MLKTIKELKIGNQDIVPVLVKSVDEAMSKTGNKYQMLHIVDKEQNATLVMNFNGGIDVKCPVVMALTLDCNEYKGGASYTLVNGSIIENASILEYLPKSDVDVSIVWKSIIEYIGELPKSLNNIVCKCISDYKDKFKSYPMDSPYFNKTNGLIDATYKLMRMSDAMSTILGVNKGLMIAGAALYYLPYVDMLNEVGEPTTSYVLLGTSAILMPLYKSCVDMGIDINTNEDARLLAHILLSRFNGGIDASIPEAEALKYLDGALQRTATCINNLGTTEVGTMVAGSATTFKPRYLYKAGGEIDG